MTSASPCADHPQPVVMGTPARWTALCKTCGTVWRSDDPGTPDWVREWAAETFAALS